jgi:hypothetical protein
MNYNEDNAKYSLECIMKRLILTLIFLIGAFSEAKIAPKEMTEFNKKCPAPKLCETIYENLQSCDKGNKHQCSQFVDNFQKALPEYDCQRSFDSTVKEKYIVPAIWLCETHEYFLNELSKMKTKKAKQLYGSKELRTTLDGHLAEEHLEKSKKVEKKLKQ